MKKSILFLISIFILTKVYSVEYVIDDFESGDLGWNTVDCYHDIRTNEFKNGINISEHVLFTNRGVANNDWTGVIRTFSTPITGYTYLHMKVYRNNSNQPNVKVSENQGAGGRVQIYLL